MCYRLCLSACPCARHVFAHVLPAVANRFLGADRSRLMGPDPPRWRRSVCEGRPIAQFDCGRMCTCASVDTCTRAKPQELLLLAGARAPSRVARVILFVLRNGGHGRAGADASARRISSSGTRSPRGLGCDIGI